MVHADAAMDLIVQAHLAVRLVLAAGKLDAIHAQIAVAGPRPLWILAVHLGQRDECPAVVRPAFELRQVADLDLAGEDRTACHAPGPRPQQGEGYADVAPGALPGRARVGLQFDQAADLVQGVAKDEARPVHGPKQVADHGEAATLDPREVEGGAMGAEHAALNLGRL